MSTTLLSVRARRRAHRPEHIARSHRRRLDESGCDGTRYRDPTYFALQALTDAAYDPESAQLISAGQPKYYVASDHLAGDDYRTLTPDDLLDLVDAGALGWNAERQTGVAFHMLSSLAVAGFIGATAIGNTPEEARAAFDHTRDVLSTTSLKEHF
jgi:hypothetical protein